MQLANRTYRKLLRVTHYADSTGLLSTPVRFDVPQSNKSLEPAPDRAWANK